MVKPAEIRPLPGQNFCAYIPDHIGSLISGLLSADHCHWSLTHVGLSLFPSSLLDLTQFPILDLDPWTGSLTLWLHIHPLCHVFWEITVTYCHFCSTNCPSTNNCLKNLELLAAGFLGFCACNQSRKHVSTRATYSTVMITGRERSWSIVK